MEIWPPQKIGIDQKLVLVTMMWDEFFDVKATVVVFPGIWNVAEVDEDDDRAMKNDNAP